MEYTLKTDGNFTYIEEGEGKPLVLLHGLFGALSNFKDVVEHFNPRYKVVIPMLPLYTMPLLSTDDRTPSPSRTPELAQLRTQLLQTLHQQCPAARPAAADCRPRPSRRARRLLQHGRRGAPPAAAQAAPTSRRVGGSQR
jgi:hypothetical protein